ncbi:MAG: 2-keto-4-pentenoate hydratase [Brevundimonas sp.]|uniref:2-keto-4-pentenoate hydratase n=1 Tax=Brevundimonas sp. TaxID=1871086 RepID=UPI00391D7A35
MSLVATHADRASEREIASRFVKARLGFEAISAYPGALPESLSQAYAIQDQAIALWPGEVRGWKLGRIPDPLVQRYGADRLAGPIFSGNIWPMIDDDNGVAVPVINGGFAAVEAEYLIRINRDVSPDERSWTREEAVDLIDEVLTGIELAGSPLSLINDLGPAVTASDFGNNAGLIVGKRVEDGIARLDDLECRMLIEGGEVGRGRAGNLPGGPLQALVFLLDLHARRGISLRAGDLISTGAVTGVHRIEAGQRALADFGTDGSIACHARAADADAGDSS